MDEKKLIDVLKETGEKQSVNSVILILIEYFKDQGFQLENIYYNREAEDAQLIASFLELMSVRISV